MTTATAITPDRAAELYAAVADPKSKWEFMDSVLDLCNAHPDMSQREVVDMIGDTPSFIALHGHHRDREHGGPAKSRLKSVKDEIAVVKTWPAADRVNGVSFEAHKVLNRLGSTAGSKILAALVKEMGGPANVTKRAVEARLKVADPDHVPQKNGKKPAPSAAGGAQTVAREMTLVEMAEMLASKLTVGELSKDAALASAVEKVADIFEAFSQRNAAKQAATAPKAAAAPKPAAPKAKKPAAPKVAAPKVRRPAVKAPIG